MDTRFEIKIKQWTLRIDSIYLCLDGSDGNFRLQIALEDIATAIKYLVSKVKLTKGLTE